MSTAEDRRLLKRVDDVIQINVMTAEQGDFLITHMPFEHLEVTRSGLAHSQARAMSEEQVYRDLIRNAKDEHRFIIVKGNNGTGKSHLIRWLQARMVNDQQNGELENEKIVFIRRIDNTLRGAVSQLLEQNVVSDPDQLQRMKTFVDSVSSMSENQLKDTILDSFITQMRHEVEVYEKLEPSAKIRAFKKPEAQQYVEFLNCGPVREKLLAPQGPITRFYELLNKPSQDRANVGSPRFEASDFNYVKDKAFRDEMQQYKTVSKIASALFFIEKNNNDQKLADVLNDYAELVIQRTAHIGGEDTSQIMTNLRKELKKQGKNLTVFIEDMTTFTGLDTELIKVLVEGNTGEYADFCRVTSVIGITNAYYDERFKGNFQDRVTHQVLVDNRSFGTPETLYGMAARYLNAFYLSSEEVQSWMQEGAKPEKIPYRAKGPDYAWDAIRIGEDDYSLFPFTKMSLVKLFDRLDTVNKTPRNFLRAVIHEQMVTFIYNRIEGVPFPSTTKDAIGTAPVSFVKQAYNQPFEALTGNSEDEEEKKAFRALLCFWGNATVTGDDRQLAGLPKEFIDSLHYSFLDGSQPVVPPGVGVAPVGNDGETPPEWPGDKSEKKQREYPSSLKKQLDDIERWSQSPDYTLQSSARSRKSVSDFLHEAITWPMEGVPTYWADLYLGDNKKVYIEGQKEKVPTAETALFVLPRSSQVANVLKGLAIRDELKDWDFEESAFYQQQIAVWLEKNKKQFVDRISDAGKIESMKELLMASMTVEYLYLGIMGGFSRDESHLREKLFKPKTDLLAVERGRDNKRYDEWGKLIDSFFTKTVENDFKDNKEILTRMVKSTTGEASASSDVVLVWAAMVDDAFNIMKRNHWDFAPYLEGKRFGKDEKIEKPYYLLQEYIPKVAAVLEDEKQNFTEICQKLPEYVPNPEEGASWKSVAEEAAKFLKQMNAGYSIGYPSEFDGALQRIKNKSDTLAAIVRNGKAVCESNVPSSMLVFFSSDPIELELNKALKTFDAIREFAEAQNRKYSQAIKNGGLDISLHEEVKAVRGQIAELMETLSQEVE